MRGLGGPVNNKSGGLIYPLTLASVFVPIAPRQRGPALPESVSAFRQDLARSAGAVAGKSVSGGTHVQQVRSSVDRGDRGSVDRDDERAVLRGRHDHWPDHQDQHQSLLRQDEGRRPGEGQGTRRHLAGLRRQVRRRQRRRGRRHRGADGRRRQGHSARAQRLHRDRADRREGAQSRHHRDHARHPARSGHRRRRQLRHRQFQGRRIDRRSGPRRRSATRRPPRRSPLSISPPTNRRSTISVTTASSPASASRSRIPSTTR